MKNQTLRRAGCTGVVLGLAGMVGGFCYDVMFVGIPYQDPTPELQQQYELHSGAARDQGRPGYRLDARLGSELPPGKGVGATAANQTGAPLLATFACIILSMYLDT